jgi:hypothetical protein
MLMRQDAFKNARLQISQFPIKKVEIISCIFTSSPVVSIIRYVYQEIVD